MSCAVFTIIGTVQLLFQRSNRWAIWAIFGAAFGLLLVASFLAWQDQYTENQAAREVGSLGLDHVDALLVPLSKSGEGTIQLSLVFNNSRDRMIEYRVDSLDAIVEGRISTIPLVNSQGLVYPLKQATFRASTIPLENIAKAPLTGKVSYVISYNTVGSKLAHHSNKTLLLEIYPAPVGVRFVIATEHED